MAEQRRALVDGLQATQAADPRAESEFVFGKGPPQRAAAATVPSQSRVQFSTRIREDFFKALKRASLQREMNGVQPFTIVEILEEAVEPWLKSNGYLS